MGETNRERTREKKEEKDEGGKPLEREGEVDG